jgi:GTP-binding protein Era
MGRPGPYWSLARPAKLRSGFVVLLGRPNVGKSTLLNALLGRKVAIVSPHPQTTRTHLLGIYNTPPGASPRGQIVFVDTPGLHRSATPMNRAMLRQARQALEGRDLTLLMVDVTRAPGAEDAYAAQMLDAGQEEGGEAGAAAGGGAPPVILVLNKIDRLADKRALLPLLERYRQQNRYAAIVPISARSGEQLGVLVEEILRLLPSGPAYFPAEQSTDQPEEFFAAELIREQALRLTREEVPHALAVAIERFEPGPRARIEAVLYCEREGQKAILIGRRGEMIRQIGAAARAEIERELPHLGPRLFLGLRVEVRPRWRADAAFLRRLDWRGES